VGELGCVFFFVSCMVVFYLMFMCELMIDWYFLWCLV
jgi:hypothetical protein